MAEPPDLDTLARRYIDLWQEQVAAMAADPEMSELMGRLIQAMTGGPGAMMPWAFSAKQESDGKRQPNPPAAAGAAPARAASDDGDHDVAELRERLAALEAQLARLEADAGGDQLAPKPARTRRAAAAGSRSGGS
jgi:uncharacterized small protein (DUF1192 family)